MRLSACLVFAVCAGCIQFTAAADNLLAAAPATPEVSWQCAANILAYEFALQMQPERDWTAGGAGAAVAAGLQLTVAPDGKNITCNFTPPPPPPAPPPAPPMPPRGKCTVPVDNVNLVYGYPSVHNVVLASSTIATAAACQALCEGNATCDAYTWHDRSTGAYFKDCFFVTSPIDPWKRDHAQAGHWSGLCNKASDALFPGETPKPWPRNFPRAYLQPASLSTRGRGWRQGVPAVTRTQADATLYVDYTKGSDTNPGTLASPLKTIAAAVAKVPALPAGARSVLLLGGTHYLAATVWLHAAHAGLTISAAPGQEAIVSGGTVLTPAWNKVGNTSKGADLYSAPVPAGLSFLELFTANTTRLVAAREPDGNPEMDENNFALHAASWLPAQDFGTATVVANTSYNRGGEFGMYSVGVGGPGNNFDPPISYWAQAKPNGGGAATYTIPQGMVVGAMTPALDPARGKGGFVFMMQTHLWGSWVYEIGATSAVSAGVQVAFGKGGQQEARGTGNPKNPGGSFYLSHRMEFLDSPDEWYHDADKNILYVAVAKGLAPPATVYPSLLEQLFRIEGTRSAPATGIRVSGLTFRHAAPTFMANYTVPSGGDYSVFRGAAVHLNQTSNCTVDHNLFDGVGGNGVSLTDFNQHTLITANEMRFVGENGVVMTGSTVWVDGRDMNQPRFNTISGNLIHHLGLYTKQSCAVFSGVSCQNTIEDNIFFHAPRALFNMNDGFGGDTHIRRNLFFASMLETHDHGPYNSWDRLPFLTNVRNGSSSLVLAYNHLSSNMFFSGSPFSIDTDDGSDMLNATNNVVVNQPLFKTDYSGHTKTFQGNVAIYGGSCSCDVGDKTNIFTGNECVGEGSAFKCVTGPASDYATVTDNKYYVTGGTGTAVCSAGPVEQGSKTYALPDTDGIMALARAKLGMP